MEEDKKEYMPWTIYRWLMKCFYTVCFVIVFEAKVTVMLFSMLQKNNEISKQSRNKLFRDFLYLTNKKYITLVAILLNDISEC